MALFESLINDTGKGGKRAAGFSVTMVHYTKLIPSENNNYSMESIKELAQMIVLSGKVEQNLLARKKTPDEYELIAGHRRRQAVKYLVEECGREEYAMLPVHVEQDGDTMSEIKLILTNSSARTRSDWERMMEVTRLTDLLKAMQTGSQEERDRFREWIGMDPGISGRELRRVVAELLGMSETKVAQLNHINNSLAPEMKDKFKSGEIGVSVANEAAGLPPEKQQELAEKEEVKLADVKAVSESDTEKESEEVVSESDTEIPGQQDMETPAADNQESATEKQQEDENREVPGAAGTADAPPEYDREQLEHAENQDVIDAEFEEILTEPVKTFDRNILQDMIRNAQETLDVMQDYWKKSQPDTYTKHIMELQAYQNLLETGETSAEEEPEPVEQPELPVLKNNDQRKEWLRDYKSWGVWYRDEHIGSTFYKYDFECGARLIVEEYTCKNRYSDYTIANHHLIGGPEPPTGSYGICKWKKYDEYNHHPHNETELVEFLKYIQGKN